jgi:folate-binding protein YgfZ
MLAPGDGCYAAYLTPQGRMVSDLRILALPDGFLVDVPAVRRAPVMERLESFIITEDVSIADVTRDLARLGVHGPRATGVLTRALERCASPLAGHLGGLREHQHVTGELAGQPVTIAGSRDIGRIGYDVYCPVSSVPAILGTLTAAGAVDVDVETWDTLRIEAGRPVFGMDMDTETIPLEAGIEGRAISQTKGCYVGQEVIIRVLHRGGGRVARRLVGIVVEDGEHPTDIERLPRPGTILRAADRDVGRVTSATWSPALARIIALGYVHRDLTEPGTPVIIALDPPLPARVSSRPFVRGLGADV